MEEFRVAFSQLSYVQAIHSKCRYGKLNILYMFKTLGIFTFQARLVERDNTQNLSGLKFSCILKSTLFCNTFKEYVFCNTIGFTRK
jgi:hypothetical protein